MGSHASAPPAAEQAEAQVTSSGRTCRCFESSGAPLFSCQPSCSASSRGYKCCRCSSRFANPNASGVEGGDGEVTYEADVSIVKMDESSHLDKPSQKTRLQKSFSAGHLQRSWSTGNLKSQNDTKSAYAGTDTLQRSSKTGGVSFAGGVSTVSVHADAPRTKRNSSTSVKLIKELEKKTSSRLQLIIENPLPIANCYTMLHLVGEGSFGSVRAAKVKATGALRAVKSILKGKKKRMTMLKTEIEITKMVDHPNIIKLYEIFEDVTSIYLVMEFCAGGHLLARVKAEGRFTEVGAAATMMQIFRAVFYLHSMWICHRDLKPENFLILTPDSVESSVLKITDFGLSCIVKPDEVLTSFAGTPAYMAPEVVAKHYNLACDMWSCGVNMYMLLCGYLPFRGESDADIHAKVSAGRYKFSATDWVDTSEDAMKLVDLLLRMDAQQRPKAQEALRHEWVTKKAPKGKEFQLQPGLVENLRGFRKQNKFKRAALHLIASLLSEDHLQASNQAFMYLDSDGDGRLSFAELQEGLDRDALHEGDAQLNDVFYEPGGEDGHPTYHDYTYTEFIAATFDRKTAVTKDICRVAFNFFDRNKDESITSSELSTGGLLGHLTARELEKMVSDLDRNGDGVLDFQEFMHMMRDEI